MESVARIVYISTIGLVTGLLPTHTHAQSVTDPLPLNQLDLQTLTPFVAPSDNGTAGSSGPFMRRVQLDALLVDGGQPLEHGLVWRVFNPVPDETGKLPLLATSEGGRANFEFEPGEYFVHVAFGLAGVTRKLSVPNNAPIEAQSFVLDAGGISLSAVTEGDGVIPPSKLRFSIYSEDFDANDQRRLIISNVKPKQVVRLNGGIYHVVSEYGTVNAVIRSDIGVEAGKLTEAAIQHRAAQLTLKLVAEAGGEAIADTAWSITNLAGDLISESVGAFPSLVLAEGEYTAIARHKERLFRRDFKVVAGRNVDVEVMLDLAN